MRITVARDPGYAPCGYLVCQVNEHGAWNTRDEAHTVLVQSDWDFPSLAAMFGYVPCECGATDGTVDCAHRTATDMISAAADWLDEHEGDMVDDPGYFV